jgi:hypothetical protein
MATQGRKPSMIETTPHHPKLDKVHIRACYICTRSIIADDEDLTLSCAAPEVSGLSALIPVRKARDVSGACGPEARFMQFQRSQNAGHSN